MDIARSDIVKSAAGRDKGKLFFVLEAEEDFLLLADGKTRKLESPKRKKRKHAVSRRTATAGRPKRSEAEKKSPTVSSAGPSPQFGGDGNPDQEG